MAHEIWQKRPEETSKAYEAFCLYRDMGPSRSLSKLNERMGKKPTYQRQIHEWSRKYDWVARCEAFDENELKVQMTDMKKERMEARKRIIRIAQGFQTAAGRRLQQILEDEDELQRLTPKDLISFFKEAVLIEMRLQGEPTETIDLKTDNKSQHERLYEELDDDRLQTIGTILHRIGAFEQPDESLDSEDD